MTAQFTQRMRTGLTLLELLVVIAIVALLAAMMAPALCTIMRHVRSAACRSNLHQIGLGHHIYSSRHDGHTIPTVSYHRQWWTTSLVPFIGSRSVLFCPEATTGQTPVRGRLIIGGRHTTWCDNRQYPSDPLDRGSYGQNMWLNSYDTSIQNWGHQKAYHFGGFTSRVPGPNRVPMVGECHWVGGYPYHWDLPWDVEWDGFQLGGHQLNRFTMNRHQGCANLLFLDGNVRPVPLSDMWQLVWNKHYVPQVVTLPWVEGG